MKVSSFRRVGVGLFSLITTCNWTACSGSSNSTVLRYEDLEPCGLSSLELHNHMKNNSLIEVPPCILYDTKPTTTTVGDDDTNNTNNRTSILTVVGAFRAPIDNTDAYDGAFVAAQMINQDNQGKGAKIGYYQHHFLKIRLVVAIVGNENHLSKDEYAIAHERVLESMIVSMKPQYILGSCCTPALDKPLAGKHRTMVLSQVGPESFYTAEDSNEYVFGVHIPSESYGIPALQALKFSLPTLEQRAKQKIRIIMNDRTLFLESTCQAVYDKAIKDGFQSTKKIFFSPQGDENGDAILNRDDVHHLQKIADEVCSAEESGDNIAIWGCIGYDFATNTILDRLKENGCRPVLIWLTNASWSYAINRFTQNVPYMFSGGQWHASMAYSDEFFASGQDMVEFATIKFGYKPTYNILGNYHAIYMMYQNTKRYVKTKDIPNIQEAYEPGRRYEEVRRHMLGITVSNSLYGPTSFNENRRNIGRGSAGLQWTVPVGSETGEFKLTLISPADQATAAAIVPAPIAQDCNPTNFVNRTLLLRDDAILTDKCDTCPVDTFQAESNSDWECRRCPDGSSTEGTTGAEACTRPEDNLISDGILIFGYLVMAINLILSCTFTGWTLYFQHDPVVQIGQKEFLLLICFGSLISTSSIMPLSFQASSLEDTTAASRACMTTPWLYSTGWILQYSGLFAKSYRMYHVMKSAEAMRRVQVTKRSTLKFLLGALLVNWAVMILWTIIDPLTWTRTDLGVEVDEDSGVLIRESVGMCDSEHLGAWLGVVLGFHLMIMVLTNVLLWNLRSMTDRYQESKYVTLASLFACEFLLLGIPILIAVKESAEARHIALCAIIAFSDMGILLFIFVPKVKFQRKGLPESTSLTNSILKRTSNQQAKYPFSHPHTAETPTKQSHEKDNAGEGGNSSGAQVQLDKGSLLEDRA